MVNFGKSSFVRSIKYDTESQSKQYERFNTVRLCLAYELRNISGSYQSIALHVYSIDSIAKSLRGHQMTLLAGDMMSKSPQERSRLKHGISSLEKFNLDSS